MSYSGKKRYNQKPKTGTQVDFTHPLSRGLVAWWLFNEGAGSQLRDIVNKNHGTLTNMTPDDWVGSPRGGGLAFDGNNDYVKAAKVITFGSNDFSVSIWFKSSSASTRRSLISNYDGNEWFHIEFNGTGFVASVGNIAMTIDGNPESKVSAPTTGLSLNDGVWHLATGVRSGNDLHTYVDGVLEATTDITGFGSINSSVPPYIGRIGNYNGFYYPGLLDDARIYNRALSAAEIKLLYQDPYCNLQIPVWRKYAPIVAPADEFIPRTLIF